MHLVSLKKNLIKGEGARGSRCSCMTLLANSTSQCLWLRKQHSDEGFASNQPHALNIFE